jgi:Tfp pilus assembly protein PilP
MRRKRIFNKMRPFLTLISFTLCASIVCLLLPDSSRGSCRINDLSLEKVDNFTKLTIYAESPFEFVHSTVDNEDGKPHRLVIDCKDAIHDLPQHNFRSGLPRGTIKAIRTSQFQAEPERIVRIVLDLDETVIYKVVESGENNRGSIAILTAQDPSFSLWNARKGEKAGSEGELASAGSPGKSVKETSKTKDDLLTSTEKRGRPDLQEYRGAKAVKKSTRFERPFSFAESLEIETQSQVSEASAGKPETERKHAEVIRKTPERAADRAVLAAASSDVFSVPKPDHKKLQSGESEGQKAESDVKKQTGKDYSPVISADPKESIPRSTTAESAKRQIKEPSPEKTLSSAAGAPKVTEAATEETEAATPNLTSREEETKVSGSPEESPMEKTELPESLMVVSPPKGAAIAAIPQREFIYYDSQERRDPFVPLTERITTEFGEVPLPTFESLTLVGILKDQEGNRALLEDERGYGYIMKSGDQIKNGFVVSVEDNKVIFQIQEYGWSKKMALELLN